MVSGVVSHGQHRKSVVDNMWRYAHLHHKGELERERQDGVRPPVLANEHLPATTSWSLPMMRWRMVFEGPCPSRSVIDGSTA